MPRHNSARRLSARYARQADHDANLAQYYANRAEESARMAQHYDGNGLVDLPELRGVTAHAKANLERATRKSLSGKYYDGNRTGHYYDGQFSCPTGQKVSMGADGEPKCGYYDGQFSCPTGQKVSMGADGEPKCGYYDGNAPAQNWNPATKSWF